MIVGETMPARNRKGQLNLSLSAGTVLVLVCLFVPGIALGLDHFPLPISTSSSSVYSGYIKINGVDAGEGDEVAFLDTDGVLCGHTRIGTAGQYGSFPVYGDDFTTVDVDEGAKSDDILTVIVWDISEKRELRDACLVLTGGDPQGSEFFQASFVPPIWRIDQGFALDIDTVSPIADVDGDCRIDLEDVILALKIIGGYEILQDVVGGSDVNADLRVGLHEVIFILETISGIRR